MWNCDVRGRISFTAANHFQPVADSVRRCGNVNSSLRASTPPNYCTPRKCLMPCRSGLILCSTFSWKVGWIFVSLFTFFISVRRVHKGYRQLAIVFSWKRNIRTSCSLTLRGVRCFGTSLTYNRQLRWSTRITGLAMSEAPLSPQ